MSRFFFGKLAAVNIRKNGRIYIPYILTCIFTICMFYIMLFITLNKGLSQMPGAQALTTIMWMGTVVIGIFAVIILLYTNSFLMKRRKKELGLYNILGMGKNHIARVMLIENLYVSLGSIVAGLFFGILLSKLMLVLLLKMLRFTIPFGFEISPIAMLVTVLVFAGIFFVTLLVNLGRVHLSKPIELLYGGNVGEKEPKTKRLLAVLGFLALGVGYTIAIVTENPVQALGWFFIAVILVILGTYFLFTAGSIALLKSLRNNKSYYYKTNHFTAISGMIYRMKQNAVGLANICVLSTMVLVMLSTTVSLYIGMEDALRYRFPRNIEIKASEKSQADGEAMTQKINDIIAQSGVKVSNALHYRYMYGTYQFDGSKMVSYATAGDDIEKITAYFLTLADYNSIQAVSETLNPGQLLIYAPTSVTTGPTISFGSTTHSVKAALDLDNLDIADNYTVKLTDTIYFILPDEDAIRTVFHTLTPDPDQAGYTDLFYYYGFDTAVQDNSQVQLSDKLSKTLSNEDTENSDNSSVYITNVESNRADFLSAYGGLFFLGIFLGALFMMAAVIIMYYKQISEGYDDKRRFEIMQKVGLSRDEVKKAIRSQVLTVFFLPLLAAGIHILAAFKMITKLLFLLNLANVQLFAVCTLGTLVIFALIYGAVYSLTARAYYKIVS